MKDILLLFHQNLNIMRFTDQTGHLVVLILAALFMALIIVI